MDMFKQLDKIFKELDKSKLFLSVIYLLYIIGGKYIEEQIGEGLKDILKLPWMKGVLLFCASFVVTKNCKISIAVAGIGFIIFRYLLQEDSHYCIFKKKK